MLGLLELISNDLIMAAVDGEIRCQLSCLCQSELNMRLGMKIIRD